MRLCFDYYGLELSCKNETKHAYTVQNTFISINNCIWYSLESKLKRFATQMNALRTAISEHYIL